MALFENFPYTNLHELNLDWLIENIKIIQDQQVLSVNGMTGEVILYKEDTVRFPDITSGIWQLVRDSNGHTSGIYFNDNTHLAYIVNGNTLERIYTDAHQPPYPVESVNGQTGVVVLYPEQYIRLPDLTDAQMTNWNLYRKLNGTNLGIQFEDDGKVYAMHGNNRYLIYTSNDQPPYPVTSVNGATGDINLYPEQNIEFPGIGAGYPDWSISKMIGSVQIGLKLSSTGAASIIVGNDEYPIYINQINDPSDFQDPTDPVLEVNDAVTGNQWGIVREMPLETVGIVFQYDPGTMKYAAYLKVGNNVTRLVTLADIPSASGVVSVNTKTGVVTLTGEDIAVSTSNPNTLETELVTINNNITDLQNETAAMAESMAIVVINDTAEINIAVGDYVLVLDSTIAGITDGLYIAQNAVTANTALVAADLDNTDTAKGGFNMLALSAGLAPFLAEQIAIVVNGSTSTKNITAQDFVLVIGSTIAGISDGLYHAVNNVTAGTPLTSADLSNTTTGNGGLNDLKALTYTASMDTTYTDLQSGVTVRRVECKQIGMLKIISVSLHITTTHAVGTALLTLPSAFWPGETLYSEFTTCAWEESGQTQFRVRSDLGRVDATGGYHQYISNTFTGDIESLFMFHS